MKIAVFGATGNIGQRIIWEAMAREHQVTAILRDPSRLQQRQPQLRVVAGDVLNPARVAAAVAGQDAIVSAVGPDPDDGDPQMRK